MKNLLSLIALSCAMAILFGANAPRARAAVLTSNVLTLKAEQSGTVQQARYRCWWRHGYRHCGFRRHSWRHGYWRHRHGYWRHRHHRYYGYNWRERGWQYRAWREEHEVPTDGQSDYQQWRDRYYAEHGYYPYRRHYYYNSYSTYTQPTYRRRHVPGDGYCIGLCWW
ncbi:hypothetical protein [Hyphomicrobium sp. 2TAF46]|uniref:hypothetical protein n=1 Tax=Hyphomicrobium sp. 2TAF46 TaxID=3233019 RepID=UPI003F8F9980